MSARERILGRLRAAPPSAYQSQPDVAGWFASRCRNEDLSQRTARLRSALQAAHVEVHDSSTTDWPLLILRLAISKHVRTLLIGTNTSHGEALEKLSSLILRLATSEHVRTLLMGVVTPNDDAKEKLRSAMPQLIKYNDAFVPSNTLFDGIDASLTLAKSAIAETGSLVLWPDASEPRLMSLVPPIHFILLDTAAIHADFHSAMCAEGWKNAMPTNALLISGPSKTSDIQQTLAYGAHGPLDVIVVLLQDRAGTA
jgi:L-lactate dehydrogenase complex protein LldG